MNNKKYTKGLKALLIVSIIVAVLFLGLFVAFPFLAKPTGDPQYVSFTEMLKYHLEGFFNLLVFKYGDPNNYLNFGLSALLYVMTFIWVVCLLVGVNVCDKKQTGIMVASFPLGLANILMYALVASGSEKYWQVVTGAEPYNGNTLLMVLALVLVLLEVVFFLLNILFYFWTMARAFIGGPQEPVQEEEPKPEPVPAPVVEEQPQNQYLDEEEEVRRIIRDEINNNQPFEVEVLNEDELDDLTQYIVVDDSALEEQPQEQPQEEPVAEEPAPEVVEEPVVEPEPEPQPEPEPEPAFEEEPAQEPEVVEEQAAFEEEPDEEGNDDEFDNFNRKNREPFSQRILKADLETKANYNELKNELLSYGVKSRLSRSGDVFRLHTKKYAKIFLVGKTLKVYLALNPEDYADATFPVEDVGYRFNYADIPLLFKVRSGLSVRRCKELIKAACEKDGLKKKEAEGVDWAQELDPESAEKDKR